METTTIQISNVVKQQLDRLKVFEKETYNELLVWMLEDNLELNEKVKQEIETRKTGGNFVSHDKVKERFGL